MMQTTDLRDRNNITLLRALDLAGRRRVSIKRKMRPGLVIISKIIVQNAHEMRFVEHNNVVKTFTSYRANQPFNNGDCHGDRKAVRTSSMPILLIRLRKSAL